MKLEKPENEPLSITEMLPEKLSDMVIDDDLRSRSVHRGVLDDADQGFSAYAVVENPFAALCASSEPEKREESIEIRWDRKKDESGRSQIVVK